MSKTLLLQSAAVIIGGFLLASPSYAAAQETQSQMNHSMKNKTGAYDDAHDDAKDKSEKADAYEIVDEAVEVVTQMKADKKFMEKARQAKGIFIVPDFGRAGLVVGGHGGGGAMLARDGDGWGNPAFYNMGGISVGAQAGASGGSIVMLLMTDDAVESFKQDNNFSLDANAGLSIINWSANAQGTAGKGDVIIWSDTEGLFAGATIGVSDINYDSDETSSFYGKELSPAEALSNREVVREAAQLRQALPG